LSSAVVLAAGGIFIVVSTVVRMRNGDWLRRVGPLEVSETTLAEVVAQLEFWQTTARRSASRIDELEAELTRLDQITGGVIDRRHS
jgi:hypothetical protein